MGSHPPTRDIPAPHADHDTDPNFASMQSYPALSFTLPTPTPTFGPRAGKLVLTRVPSDDDLPADRHHNYDINRIVTIEMDTPNILVGTSRGVVPHFSRDHANGSDAVRWINVPFESFLGQVPPIPTLQTGSYPLHRFLGFDTKRHITSLCLRNPLDTREMPPNGNTHVAANCVRGVRKVTTSDWRYYVYKMQPDVVFALSDTPFTPPPHSQKRVTKSIERSTAWIADILRPLPGCASLSDPDSFPRTAQHPLNVFVHMTGGTSLPAREAFAYGLREKLHGVEADAVKPLQCLDDGISGYSFDLAVLRGIKPSPNTSYHQSLPNGFLQQENPEIVQVQNPEEIVASSPPTMVVDPSPVASSASSMAEPPVPPKITALLQASLAELPVSKPRLMTGVRCPHEMLHLVRDVGVDLFDATWAINAANIGVALDFVFPVPPNDVTGSARRHLGHNLYDPVYAHQFSRLADNFHGAGERAESDSSERDVDVCPCIACSPRSPSSHIRHSTVDQQSYEAVDDAVVRYEKPYRRAYLHHLLHTHEMSAHTLLVAHNLAVVSAFLAGVRGVVREDGKERVGLEIERFESAYDESWELFKAARQDWECVDRARGKGRLARERAKQLEEGKDDDELE